MVDYVVVAPKSMTLSDFDGRVQGLYIGVVDTGIVAGPEAVLTAVNTLFDGHHSLPTTHVDLCLTTDGIMLTDNLRRYSRMRRQCDHNLPIPDDRNVFGDILAIILKVNVLGCTRVSRRRYAIKWSFRK